MTIETLVVGQMATNCYLVDTIIIDPGDDAEYILSHLTTRPSLIIATHGHFDHIMAAFALQQALKIPFLMHKQDAFLLKKMQQAARHFLNIATDPPPRISRFIRDGEKIGDLSVLHTPGHTPGSISLVGDGVVFSGDAIFADGAVGRTDHEYSDTSALSRSIQKILSLPPRTKIFSGHGHISSVKRERAYHAVVQ
jgi:hydroxyacylglutathione hydrolase